MKKKKIILSICIIIFTITGGGIAGGTYLLLNKPLKGTSGGILYIDTDDTSDSIFTKLDKQLHATQLTGLRLLFALQQANPSEHTGAYRFSSNEATWQIFSRLRSGSQTPVRLTLNSVRTLDKLARNVSRQIMADSSSLASLITDSTYITRFGFTPATLPAFFLPNTYEVYWNMSPDDFMNRMKREYDRFWNKQRKALADSIGFSPVEVSILASIVDEETANTEEKPIIAGLYINRLKRNIPLQADPTIKYGLQDFTLRRILLKHLKTDSPYNTYKYAGLPPGPIRIPSLEGINSVLHYTRHPYLYMCAKEDFSGTHRFARTLGEHHANARKYQKALNHRKIYR